MNPAKPLTAEKLMEIQIRNSAPEAQDTGMVSGLAPVGYANTVDPGNPSLKLAPESARESPIRCPSCDCVVLASPAYLSPPTAFKPSEDALLLLDEIYRLRTENVLAFKLVQAARAVVERQHTPPIDEKAWQAAALKSWAVLEQALAPFDKQTSGTSNGVEITNKP